MSKYKLLAQGVEYYPDTDTLLLIRCPKCNKENYAPNVAKGIILGANAVLKEILRYIGNHSSFESDILKDKFKELKGEQL